MPDRNPSWAREELILALELYFRHPPRELRQDHAEVIELSKVLNSLRLHTSRPDVARFRNPNGVYMKLCNFLAIDPDYNGKGLARGGKLEHAIWKEFCTNREKLRLEAASIRIEAR
jgi:5-methylcytosine-specific restriction protein A